MTRLSQTFQFALGLAMVVGAMALTSARAAAQDGADGESRARRALQAAIECGWMPAAPELPLNDGAEYAEVTERDPSESEGDEDHSRGQEAAPTAPASASLRAAANNVQRTRERLNSSRATVSSGAPRGPPS